MQFWSSSEVQSDVADSHRPARKDLELAINNVIAERSYGDGVSQWALIYIILDEGDDYPELNRYQKKNGVAEFRLVVDYTTIRACDHMEHRKVLAQTIVRSLDLAKTMKIASFDLDAFSRDVVSALAQRRWL